MKLSSAADARPVTRARALVAFILLTTAMFLLPGVARAQLQTLANITGTVQDSSGASVPGAKIVVQSAALGITRETQSSADGRFTVALLPAGPYTVSVHSPGLTEYTTPEITLTLGQTVDIPFLLTPKGTSTQVDVTAAIDNLNTDDENIATDVSSAEIVGLPLAQRNVFQLQFLDSSMVNSTMTAWEGGNGSNGFADQNIAFATFLGSRFGDTEYLLDGHWDTDGQWGGVIYVPSVDETGEFKLQTNSYSAQYGFSSGNVINAITKGGTNQLHGDAFEFLRNTLFNANNYFSNANGLARNTSHINQFGFTLGGPVVLPKIYNGKNKSFFFADYEGFRSSVPTTDTYSVPTAAFKSGDFSSLLGGQIGVDALGRPVYSGELFNPYSTRQVTAGQIDSSTGLVATTTGYVRDPYSSGGRLNVLPANAINTIGAKLLTYYPNPLNSLAANNFIVATSSRITQDSYTVRFDQNLTDQQRIFFRYSNKNELGAAENPDWGTNDKGGPGRTNPDPRWDLALNYTNTLSSSLVMSASLGWNRWDSGQGSINVGYDLSQLGWNKSFNQGGGVFPSVGIAGYSGLGSGGGAAFYPRTNRDYNLSFSKQLNRHLLTFGVEWLDLYYNNEGIGQAGLSFSPDYTGQFLVSSGSASAVSGATGYGLASELVGAGNGSFTIPGTQTYHEGRFAGYLQDDLKLTPKLTLNVGLRYEIQASPTDRFNTMSYFDPKAANPLSSAGLNVPGELVFAGRNGAPRNIITNSYTYFAPRVGFAWNPTTRLVVRAAYGIFYPSRLSLGTGQNETGASGTTYWNTTGGGAQTSSISPLSSAFQGQAVTPSTANFNSSDLIGDSVVAPEHDFGAGPRVQNWMFGIQFALTSHDKIEAEYSGNYGQNLNVSGPSWNIDALPDSDLAKGATYLNSQVANPFFGKIASSQCGLNNATVPQYQLLLPFPEYCSVYALSQPAGFDTYNALKFTWTRSMSHGVQFIASYTRSKWLDDVTGNQAWQWGNGLGYGGGDFRDMNNIKLDKAVDASDTPNSFVLSFVADLPFGHGRAFGTNTNRVVDAVFGGWQVSGIYNIRSGQPLHFSQYNNTIPYGGGQNPDILFDPLQNWHQTISAWFNPKAFTQATGLSYGTAPRDTDYLRAPGFDNLDFTLQKFFTITEHVRLNLRGEAFNVFNHANFLPPDTNVQDSSFGVITGTYPARQLQVAAKLYW